MIRTACVLVAMAVFAAPVAAQVPDHVVFDGTGGQAASAPIVMVLHGGGGSGAQVRRTSGFDKWAAKADVVAVYPSGEGRVWNDGRMAGRAGYRGQARRDDVAALLDLAASLDRQGLGDAGKLFIVGHSNGGAMAMRIACAHPDAISAIAVVATKVLLDAPCENPDDPVPAVFFFGTADELSPHAGRKDASNRRDAVLGLSHSAEESLAIWSGRNRCGAREPAQMINLADDGVTVRRYDWGSCAAALRYFETEGGGHAWPGARARRTILPRQTPEAVVRDIDAGQESLRFFMGL